MVCFLLSFFRKHLPSDVLFLHTLLTQRAESTRKRAVPVQSICRPINFEGYYIYINMIGQQLTDSCNWDQLSCFRISADRQELASFYTLEQKFETNVMWLINCWTDICDCIVAFACQYSNELDPIDLPSYIFTNWPYFWSKNPFDCQYVLQGKEDIYGWTAIGQIEKFKDT